MKISITISRLERLLYEQKERVINQLYSHSYVYNNKSDEGHARSLDIDEDKMRKLGMKTEYPSEFDTLKKYVED